MKIRNVNNLGQELKTTQSPEPHAEGPARGLMFKKAITDQTNEQHLARINGLAKEIDAQGERLIKRADIKELEKFRSLIRDFIGEVVSGGYEFSKENAMESRGRFRLFATVKTIDEKLDKLAKEVLKEQSDNLVILNEVDDIRGLILDILL